MTLNLDELEKLANAATPGPWIYDDGQIGPCPEDTPDFYKHKEINPQYPDDPFMVCWNSFPMQYGCECGKYNSDNDGEFIVAAITAVPELIREVRRLREALIFYADSHQWQYTPHDDQGNGGDAIGDGGERARKALEGR